MPLQGIDALVREILTSRVYDVARETPLDHAPRLSARLDNEVLLKREDLQPIFSFKIRGAYNRIVRLSASERSRGVIAASAGNHAQGVALSARRLGLRAVIVMPRTTPDIKIDAVKALGAEVVLFGDHYAQAQGHCDELAVETGMTFVHPFDDPLVIAGQGTVGVELVRQSPEDLTAIFVPVGGGGLIAGIGAYVKTLLPRVHIMGVEPVDADAMAQSLDAGRRVRLEHVGGFADGVAVQQVGEQTFPIARETVSGVVRVTNDEICAAIKDIFDDTRTIAEPAGALAVAGLKAHVERHGMRGQRFAAIVSGANMNFDRLRFVAEEAELGEAREAVLAVTIPERPGSFKTFCSLIGARNITEFNYRYAHPTEAHVFVGISVRDRSEKDTLLRTIGRAGIRTLDLTDNELAKLHIRHLVGGPANAPNELLYRFEFPERPGALMRFLDAISQDWNISLFHYRNHGADYGRILAGIQVPPSERRAFKESLRQLGYLYVEETTNPAAALFLGA